MNTLYGLYNDWPINYKEIVPYYEKAEFLLGVKPSVGIDELSSINSSDYELPYLDLRKKNRLQVVPYGNQSYFVKNLVPYIKNSNIDLRTNAVLPSQFIRLFTDRDRRKEYHFI